jgi:hypothetical protein
VVDEAVDHGGGDDIVAEHLSPAAELLVGGDDQGGVLITGRDELEEQVRRLGFERDVADFVDLCRYPHSATYADTATMPRNCRRGGAAGPAKLGFSADFLGIVAAGAVDAAPVGRRWASSSRRRSWWRVHGGSQAGWGRRLTAIRPGC